MFIILIFLSSIIISVNSTCVGTPHTQHTISVNSTATCVLAKLFEPQSFCLVDIKGNDMIDPFDVSPEADVTFSMIFNSWFRSRRVAVPFPDFNMEYALTCVQKNVSIPSPKVIFSIGANGIADPRIETINLYGAKGYWNSNGDGEDYVAEF
jgi:hypothetical protein